METSSRTEWAERRLRSTIVSGELPPGSRVRVEELAAEWTVSPTPLREGQGESLALTRRGGAFYTVPEGLNATIRRYAPVRHSR